MAVQLYKHSSDAVREVKNIFCVGRNYGEHALELGNAVPTEPMIFGKCTHAAIAADGDIQLPAGSTDVHHELEVVLWISRDYEPGIQVADITGGIALGLDLTDREAQNKLKAKGHPWEFAKGFRHSAVLTSFYTLRPEEWGSAMTTPFSLTLVEPGGMRTAQVGRMAEMIFSLQTLVDFVGRRFDLRPGDILYSGTPAGVGPLTDGIEAHLRFGDATWGRCRFGLAQQEP